MLCNYLNDIYLNHIHPSLLKDEFIYSAEAKQTFLDLWFSCNNIRRNFSNNSYYYMKNELLFKIIASSDSKKQLLYCHYDKVWGIFEFKYHMQYGDIYFFIQNVVENTLKLKSTIPSRFGQPPNK
jgi:hypothetical protein